MVDTNTCAELDDMVEKDMRLKQYGGTQDAPISWWPPNVPGY